MNDVTEWLAKAARCRRLAMVTSDQKARDALLALAAEMDDKVIKARGDPRHFPELGRTLTRPAG